MLLWLADDTRDSYHVVGKHFPIRFWGSHCILVHVFPDSGQEAHRNKLTTRMLFMPSFGGLDNSEGTMKREAGSEVRCNVVNLSVLEIAA